MKNSTLIGLLLGVTCVFGGFLLEGGGAESLLLFPAMLIVIGGTIATAIIGSSWQQVAKLPQLFAVAMTPRDYAPQKIIEQIVKFAALARREGILAIERRMKEVEHPYLRKLFKVAIDGADPDSLRKIATTEIDFIYERHNRNIQLFSKMGGYSPTMGIIGTVMGLISTLAAAGGDPEELIRHIATAFIATLWGIVMANLVWLPMADKLQSMHDDEMQLLNIMVEGVSSLQLGETPSVIRAKLAGALPLDQQEAFLKKPLGGGQKKKTVAAIPIKGSQTQVARKYP